MVGNRDGDSSRVRQGQGAGEEAGMMVLGGKGRALAGSGAEENRQRD